MINICVICGKEFDEDGLWCKECEESFPFADLDSVDDQAFAAAEWAAKRAREVAEEKYKKYQEGWLK